MTADTPRTLPAWIRSLWTTLLFPGQPDAAINVRSFSLIILLLWPAVLLYPAMNFRLLEPDEGRYAQIPKEMLLRGEWVVPTLQGEPYLDKPPMMYWLVKLSYSLFGVSESAARLVPALCVHATILAVYLFGRRSLGERAAFWAALLLSVAPGYVGIARLLLLDGLLTFCVTLSVLSGYEAVRTGTLKRGWWFAAALFSGLGFLTKGPISEVLLFPPLFAIAWLTGSMARVGWRYLCLFIAIVIGINLPWYIAIYLREPAFLKHFFWDHNVMRFVQPFDHLQPVWYYVPILLAGFLPGTILFVLYFRHLVRGSPGETHSAAGGFWLLAGVWCVAFFSISGSKLPTYILPAYPFLCLALGEFVARNATALRVASRLSATFGALVFAGLNLALPWYAQQRSPFGQPEIVKQYLHKDKVVVTYPRNCDSAAYYFDRADFQNVRSKEINDLMVAMHHRPQTVILFSHRHAYEAFRDALPPSLEVAERVSMRRPLNNGLLNKLVGDTPWGLADIAVIRPVAARGQID